MAALNGAPGCTPAPPDDQQTTPDTQDQSTPPPLNPGSISGQLTVQTDEGVASLTIGSTEIVASPPNKLDALVQRSVPSTPASADVSDTSVPGELLVTFDDTTIEQRQTLLADAGMRLIECSPTGVCRTEPADVTDDDKSLRLQRATDARTRLTAQPGIRHIESHRRRFVALEPNDIYFPYQWHYSVIHLPEAWDMTVGSNDVIVAVIDTGILAGHPDLQGRIIAGYDFIADPAAARDGDGRDPDPEDEGDRLGGPGQSSFHGTHVAGTVAAATNNSSGVAGGTWKTKIMPLRALGVDGGTSFDVSEAIRYAAGLSNVTGQLPTRRADIINLSLVGAPGEGSSSDELSAIAAASAAGVIIVGAAGNDGSSSPAYPAAAPEVISVSAVDIQLQKADYSNYGSTIDLAAPGGYTGSDLNGDGFADGVLSTGASDRNQTITYQYVFANGTSMAAPHVAAVAALVLAANPSLSAAAVRDVLETTARDLGPTGRDDSFGYGLVDAAAAVREAYRRAGTDLPVEARLTVSNDTVNLGSDRSDYRVQVANTGGGELAIESVTTHTFIGNGWLAAQADPVADGASATDLVISVDRTGLPDGDYTGTVTVTAAGLTPVDLDVLMTVGLGFQATETIYILAVDPVSHDTIGEAATQAAFSYFYTISELPSGSYILYAGTDRNDDGYICEDGDLCGALPSRLEPEIITLNENQNLAAADFSVARLVLQQQTAAQVITFPLRRTDK